MPRAASSPHALWATGGRAEPFQGLPSGLRTLCERPCPLGFSRAVIVVTERVEAAEAAGEAEQGAVAKSLPWEADNGRRSAWCAMRKKGRAPMEPFYSGCEEN